MARITGASPQDESLYAPLDAGSDAVQELMAYLDIEHREAESAYGEYYDQLSRFRRAIKAEPNTRIKTFPWPGASNFVVPLLRITGDAIKARVVNTLLAPKPFWIVNAAGPGAPLTEYATPMQEFLEWGSINDIRIPDVVDAVADQTVYMGKTPVKVHWSRDVRKVRAYSLRTNKPVDRIRVLRDGPMFEPIMLENWLEPWGLTGMLAKPWNTHKLFYRVGELKQQAKQKVLPAEYDFDSLVSNIPENILRLAELQRISWGNVQIVPVYETYVDYDIDHDGHLEQLIVKWSPLAPTKPLTVKYNYFWHGQRPLGCLFYLRDSADRSAADGICQLLWSIQDSLSTFVNQRTDNITLANTRFWMARKNAVEKGVSVWPGKVQFMNDPQKDMVAAEMGMVSPQSFTHESVVRDYAERLSGIGDPQLGREYENPRVAATTTLSMLQEGNKRFDMIINGIRLEFARLGTLTVQLYQQFQPRVDLGEILSPESAALVGEILSAEPEVVEAGFNLVVNTSSVTQNSEAGRQARNEVSGLIQGFYGQVIKVTLEIIANQQYPEPVKRMAIEITRSSYLMIMAVINSYDLPDADKILVDPTPFMEEVLAGADAERAMEDMVGGAGMAAPNGNGIPPEVAALMAGVAGPASVPGGNGASVGGGVPPPPGAAPGGVPVG